MDTKLDGAQKLYDKGKYRAALALYEAETGANPNNALAHEGMAKTLYRLGRHVEAWSEATKALEIDPTLVISHFVRCDILLIQQNCKMAEKEMREVVKLHPDLDYVYNKLADILILDF